MSHGERIIDQFTRMAEAFATAPHIMDRDALDLLLRVSGAGPGDRSLDVACGAGIVVCHFASVVRHATGIDVTPAMIDKARSLQSTRNLSNVSWDIGNAEKLPYPSSSFAVVTSRYALHHLQAPCHTLAEMTRVCEPGGTVAVADICVSEDRDKADRFNALELLHDPSHVRAMPLSEHLVNFRSVGLSEPSIARYKLDFKLSSLLHALGHRPEDAARAETMVRESIAEDSLGTESRLPGDEVIFSYPIAVLAGKKSIESAI